MIEFVNLLGDFGSFLIGVSCVLVVVCAIVESIRHFYWLHSKKRAESKYKQKIGHIVRWCGYWFPEFEDFEKQVFSNGDISNFRDEMIKKYNRRKEQENNGTEI